MPSATPRPAPDELTTRAAPPRRSTAPHCGKPCGDAAKLLPIAYVVATAMLAMSVVLIIGDLVVPLRVFGS